MSEAAPEIFLVREESIQRLERIIFALSEVVKKLDPEQQRSVPALRSAITCRCVRCGVSVGGEELLELPELPAKSESGRIKRLRQGQCAREDCKSTDYELILHKHPDLDWQNLLSPPETEEEKRAKREMAEAEELKMAKRSARWRSARLALLVLIAILLWVWRQYYIGGTIPFLREPEKFRVDTGPEVQRTPEH
jgi:hypothetical protein